MTVDRAPAEPTHQPELLTEGMARVAASVCVVTTDGPGRRFGQTVSAMCSVSATPPILLACVNRRSPLCRAVRTNGCFAVDVLSDRDVALADVFAGRPGPGRGAHDFGWACWSELVTGSPVLDTAAAVFDCRLREIITAGTHLVVLGDVAQSATRDVDPLAYGRRRYGRHLPFLDTPNAGRAGPSDGAPAGGATE